MSINKNCYVLLQQFHGKAVAQPEKCVVANRKQDLSGMWHVLTEREWRADRRV